MDGCLTDMGNHRVDRDHRHFGMAFISGCGQGGGSSCVERSNLMDCTKQSITAAEVTTWKRQ